MTTATRSKMEAMGERLGVKVYPYDKIDSTNNKAKKVVKELIENHNTNKICELFVADQQTAGRGRLGRHWVSPPGTGIWMSLAFTPDVESDKVPGITLIAAMSVVRAIRFYSLTQNIFNVDVNIKWPNDIILNGKKIGGILCELVYDPETEKNYVICGIGINVNTKSFDSQECMFATSLFRESGLTWDRQELAYGIISNLRQGVLRYEKEKTLGFMLEDYNRLLVSMDQEVILSSENPDIQAGLAPKYICKGIDETGALLVEDPSGEVLAITSGEVSVRGLYGYT